VSVRPPFAAQFVLAVATACAVPGTAHADAASDAAGAKDLFERGRDLRSQGNCAEALPFFRKAYTLYPPGLGSLRNIAVCQETLGHVASARAAWLELRRAIGGSTDPKYAGWSDDADREMARLAPRVSTLTVGLTVLDPSGQPAPGSTPREEVGVTVDGHPLPKDKLGVAIEHDPGTVVVRASGAGAAGPDEQALTLGPGENRAVELHVTVAPPLPKAQPQPELDTESRGPAAAPGAPARSSSQLRTSAWIALGFGASGLAGAAVAFAVRQSALGALRSSCPGYASTPCSPANEASVVSDVDRGRVASTTLSVLGVIGIASTAASIVLFAASGSSSSSSAIVLTPTGVGAEGTF
jgi:hypothetical protein